jgi:predicted PurR-regulated permease PerM
MDELPSAVSDENVVVGRIDVRTAAVTVMVLGAVIFVLREGVELFAPVLVSVLLAYALQPFVAALTRCRLPRILAVIVVYALLAAGFGALAHLAQRQFVGFLNDLPRTVAALKPSFQRQARPSNRSGAIEHLQRAASDLKATIDASAPEPAPDVSRVVLVDSAFDVREYLARAWPAVLGVGTRLFLIAVLTFLFLVTGETLERKLIAAAGPRFDQQTVDVIRTIERQIERYLVARLLISTIVAVATGFALWWLGVSRPIVLGVLAGALNVVPIVGPAIGVAMIAIVAFLQFHTIEMTAAVGGLAAAIAVLEGNLISPWLVSRAGELNTVAVFVSVLFWGWMWDAWGLVLAVPIMVTIKAAADHIEPLQPLGELLGR